MLRSRELFSFSATARGFDSSDGDDLHSGRIERSEKMQGIRVRRGTVPVFFGGCGQINVEMYHCGHALVSELLVKPFTKGISLF